MKRPGLQVRSRSGYTAPSGRPSPTPAPSTGITSVAIANALASPLPTSGVPLTVFAAPYRGNSGTAAVAIAIEVDASRFDFVEKNGVFTEHLEVAHTVTDAKRKDALPDASQRGPRAETGDVRANEDRRNQGALAHGFAAGAIPAAGGRR